MGGCCYYLFAVVFSGWYREDKTFLATRREMQRNANSK